MLAFNMLSHVRPLSTIHYLSANFARIASLSKVFHRRVYGSIKFLRSGGSFHRCLFCFIISLLPSSSCLVRRAFGNYFHFHFHVGLDLYCQQWGEITRQRWSFLALTNKSGKLFKGQPVLLFSKSVYIYIVLNKSLGGTFCQSLSFLALMAQ